MNGTYLTIEGISKSFGTEHVLNSISMNVMKGEFVTILGSSGAGKTTLLRIIAGLEYPDAGAVILDGTDITYLPPEKRRFNMIFQNYALFEHMTVAENVGYSLKFMKLGKDERHSRVTDMLETVGLKDMADKLPSMLSGGQRQRVAIARAIINEPGILLMDEPLGALDRNLRKHMQAELRELRSRLGITCIYITHDQEEAVFLSDRIAILNKGSIVQMDTTDNIITSDIPYVREFLGRNIEAET